MLTHLSLCSGIGGIDLAAQWAGFINIGHSEIDPFACQVLAKNFKGVKNYGDIKKITAKSCPELRAVTVISAGFPCQPYSDAGKRLSTQDDRDLWPEVFRVIKELRPAWFIGENVAGFINLGLDKTITDLESQNYTARAFVLPACSVGADHIRSRVFIVAYANSKRRCVLAHGEKDRCANVNFKEFNHTFTQRSQSLTEDVFRFYVERLFTNPSSGIHRNDDGLSLGLDRLRCLGNAVVPQQVYPILKAIAEIENIVRNKKTD